MASPLDLQEQEQLDQIKSFWNQYGNLITWTVTLALAGFAGWNVWQWWQREQGAKAGALYDELDRLAASGDVEKTTRAFSDLKERFPRTLQTQQGALLAAKVQAEKAKPMRPWARWAGWPRMPAKTSCAASRACAPPACCLIRRSSTTP